LNSIGWKKKRKRERDVIGSKRLVSRRKKIKAIGIRDEHLTAFANHVILQLRVAVKSRIVKKKKKVRSTTLWLTIEMGCNQIKNRIYFILPFFFVP
jgi:hypothetical protein